MVLLFGLSAFVQAQSNYLQGAGAKERPAWLSRKISIIQRSRQEGIDSAPAAFELRKEDGRGGSRRAEAAERTDRLPSFPLLLFPSFLASLPRFSSPH